MQILCLYNRDMHLYINIYTSKYLIDESPKMYENLQEQPTVMGSHYFYDRIITILILIFLIVW